MKTLFALLGIILFFGKGNALECYSCGDCLPSLFTPLQDTDTCGILHDRCYKEIEDDGSVNRGCTDSITCTFKDVSPVVASGMPLSLVTFAAMMTTVIHQP